MLKKSSLNRILFTTIAIFIVTIIYSLGITNKNIKIDNISFIDIESTQDIYTITDDNYVSKTTIYVDKALSLEEKVKELINTMIEKNNKNALLPNYFNPILPRDTKILDVKLDKNILKINFSKELLNITEGQSEKMLESLVYTLTEFDDVLGIEIYIENELLKYVPHTNKELPTILTKEIGVNKIYDFTNINNVNKVVLYYLSKSDDEIYYVPVTKYLNDNREKIEIIIEELANNFIFQNNLISYLNSDAELLNYTLDENEIVLTFNEKIYDNIESGLILDEVINSICYSIKDNYDVQTVVFAIKDHNIFKKNLKNIE